jgi:DNA-binding response OmpR family regulator
VKPSLRQAAPFLRSVTAYPDEQTRLRARRAGILCYLSKPFSPEELCACVDAALARAR